MIAALGAQILGASLGSSGLVLGSIALWRWTR